MDIEEALEEDVVEEIIDFLEDVLITMDEVTILFLDCIGAFILILLYCFKSWVPRPSVSGLI